MVSAGLEMTGVTAWAGQLLIRGAGEDSRARLLVLMMALVALLTALISVNGAVAALLPVVVVIAVRLKRHSSQLLMPMVFSAHAGSLLALTGTPVNVLVSEAAADAGVGGFGFFEFALAGLPLLAGSIVIMVLFGRRLLPERNGATMPADFSRHAKTLVEQYGLASGVFQLRVRANSPLVGASRVELGARRACRARADGGAGQGQRPADPARADFARATSSSSAATPSRRRNSPPPCTSPSATRRPPAAARRRCSIARSGLAEVVIPPRSKLIGQAVFSGHGDRERRPDHPGRAARRRADRPAVRHARDAAASSSRPATACCCRAPGRRSTSTSTTPTCSSSTRPNWSAARRCRWGRARSRRSIILVAMVVAARHRHRAARGGRPARRRRDHPRRGSCGSTRPTARSTGRR